MLLEKPHETPKTGPSGDAPYLSPVSRHPGSPALCSGSYEVQQPFHMDSFAPSLTARSPARSAPLQCHSINHSNLQCVIHGNVLCRQSPRYIDNRINHNDHSKFWFESCLDAVNCCVLVTDIEPAIQKEKVKKYI